MTIKLIDCTLRDGGYYNDWDFEDELVHAYLLAMDSLNVDYVEIGFRFLSNNEFKGPYAYSRDGFIRGLPIPKGLINKIGVMVNGSDLLPKDNSQNIDLFQEAVLEELFSSKSESPITLVRIACHVHEFINCLNAAKWLKLKGYTVGFNLMQVASYSDDEIKSLVQMAKQEFIDVLYFADSIGSLNLERTKQITQAVKDGWPGSIGIHTHDNMGLAISNTLAAISEGVSWVDSTVTGMGRGPGNAQTEYLVLALADRRPDCNPTNLFKLLDKYFKPMQVQYGWGINPYYYLAGKYNIHPTFIQEMLSDNRFSKEDIVAAIDQLRLENSNKFNHGRLNTIRDFYQGNPAGDWSPKSFIEGRDVLILGAGPSVIKYKKAIEVYIRKNQPLVMALNAQELIDESLIDLRIACHPVRLLADCHRYIQFPQPLVTPVTMLPKSIADVLHDKTLFDYGIQIKEGDFSFYDNYCSLPNSLVAAYALAVASAGRAKQIFLAGFDGYGGDDPRRKEMEDLFRCYFYALGVPPVISVTPTRYDINCQSIYAM